MMVLFLINIQYIKYFFVKLLFKIKFYWSQFLKMVFPFGVRMLSG